MAFNTYTEGLKKASDLANRAIATEASLSSLSPLVSPLPTLQKAFPLYISSAEAYSHLLSSNLVPEQDRAALKKKWRLVLERAEKVKKRVEELGQHVGKVETGDQGEEDAVRRRGGQMNGVSLTAWSNPPERDFRGAEWRDQYQPELAKEQLALDPVWKQVDHEAWSEVKKGERIVVRQGPGADCSVVAGVCACLEHNRRWGTSLAQDVLWPQSGSSSPKPSENGMHIVKLLLNGEWRGVVMDALLPHSNNGEALYATSRAIDSQTEEGIGSPWIPLIMKGYFKAHGGYSLGGSNPAPDIYTLTGWLPEQLSLKDGFQREKDWKRIKEGWDKGEVLVTLGTGKEVEDGLIPLHAYAVLDLKEEGNERILEIYDPGISRLHTSQDVNSAFSELNLGEATPNSGFFNMSWDTVCAKFETLSLNWTPSLRPVIATKHWSWPKPIRGNSVGEAASNTRYRLTASTGSLQPGDEVWILLSQYITSKDRSLDDIALHVHEDFEQSHRSTSRSSRSTFHQEKSLESSPYSNSVHILVRHTIRYPTTTLTILPVRDHGLFRTGFTLQAFAPSHFGLQLERLAQSLPFSIGVDGALTARNAGGHGGLPSWMDNPQYKVTLNPPSGQYQINGAKTGSRFRIMLWGDKTMAWNVKLLWGKGELVFEWSEDMVVTDSGAYSYGMAYIDTHSVEPGTYTLVVSSFESRRSSQFGLSIESGSPATIVPIPAEGAGMFNRVVSGTWTKGNSGGRPGGGTYDMNPRLEITLPKECTLMTRALFPSRSPTPVPLNLTLFRRGERGTLAEQIATSGPYSDSIPGVTVARTRLQSGIYILVISPWEKGMGLGEKFEVRVWADGPLEVEMQK